MIQEKIEELYKKKQLRTREDIRGFILSNWHNFTKNDKIKFLQLVEELIQDNQETYQKYKELEKAYMKRLLN